MRDVVYNVVKDELNWRERIIVKIFRKTFIKVCHVIRIIEINNLLK